MPDANARFYEGWASGSTGALGMRANNCLAVTVADGNLIVAPRGLFKYLVPGFNFRVPLTAIQDATPHATLFGGKYIDLSFADPKTGQSRTMSLPLKQPDAFLAAIGK